MFKRWLFILFLAVAGAASARELLVCPERGVQPFLGLDDTSAPTQVRDGRAIALQNVRLDVSRSLAKRYGVTVVGDTCDVPDDTFAQSTITGLYYTRFSSGAERIIRTCNDRFQYLSGTTWVRVSATDTISGTVVITGGKDNQFVWVTALDNIIGANGVDRPIQWNGTTLTLVDFTDLPNSDEPDIVEVVAFFKNYLIVANTTENGINYPTRFRWSNIGTINNWDKNNYIDIGALAGQEIVGAAELYDNLYFFLTHSIYKVSLVGGVNTFNVAQVSDTIGAIAKNSIKAITLTNAQMGLVFLDRSKKVYFFNGIYPQDISVLIQTTLGGLISGRMPYAVAADTKTDYYLCVSKDSSAINDLCLDFQYQIGEWTKHTNLHANAMATVVDSTSTRQTYFGNYHGLTYQLGESASLRNDVGTFTDTVDSISTYTTSTATGLQVLYFDSANLVTSALVGAPLEIVGGTSANATGIIVENTASGLVIADAISPTPDATSQIEVGAIDAFYTTKWYDMGFPTRLKHFGKVYFWADADVTSTIAVSYGTDYNENLGTSSMSLDPSNTTWTGHLYGTNDSVFRQVNLETEGRTLQVKFADDDPNEIFHLYGFNKLYYKGE